MNAAEQALVDQSPTFADLCWKVREARRAFNRTIEQVDAAKAALKAAEEARDLADDADDFARKALDSFIDRECEVDA